MTEEAAGEFVPPSETDVPHGSSRIRVTNVRDWVGNPRSARLRVILDGCRVGVAPYHGSFTCVVEPGRHEVRVATLWLASAPRLVTAGDNEVVDLVGDIPRELQFLRRMWLAIARPRRSLVLRDGSQPHAEVSDGSGVGASAVKKGGHTSTFALVSVITAQLAIFAAIVATDARDPFLWTVAVIAVAITTGKWITVAGRRLRPARDGTASVPRRGLKT